MCGCLTGAAIGTNHLAPFIGRFRPLASICAVVTTEPGWSRSRCLFVWTNQRCSASAMTWVPSENAMSYRGRMPCG